jgi:hypothetical protein
VDAATREALEAGVAEARETLADALPKLGRHANGWSLMTDTIGVYGNAYLQRAAVALAGLGANPAEDAIYPLLLVDADGDRLAGEQAYVLHFEADELPPVAAFWSITMYDAEGFQVANELDRFAIGDRDPLTFNADGSLDIWLQHDNPGPERTSNWLPAPGGPLGVTMRLYAPDREILDGTWTPPAVRAQRVSHKARSAGPDVRLLTRGVRLPYGRRSPSALEDLAIRRVESHRDAQRPGRRRQPGARTLGPGVAVLDPDVQRSVRVERQRVAIADGKAIELVGHLEALGVVHRDRPERRDRW